MKPILPIVGKWDKNTSEVHELGTISDIYQVSDLELRQ
jgi:hypothetical protein